MCNGVKDWGAKWHVIASSVAAGKLAFLLVVNGSFGMQAGITWRYSVQCDACPFTVLLWRIVSQTELT